MAVKKSNTRIIITISKKQYNWLVDQCCRKQMKMSKLISWLLWQKTKDVENTTELLNNPDSAILKMENETETNEEWHNLIAEINKSIKENQSK